jgi:phosphatidylserine decarboxylase
MIKVYNRNKKSYEIEKVAGGAFIKALYGTKAGKLGLELLIKRKLYSSITGVYCDLKMSSGLINKFVESYGINMSECCGGVESFKSFNDFFTRKLKPESRPFDSNPDSFLSPGDGRILAWRGIDINRLIQVKGSFYSLRELLDSETLAEKYSGGTLIILRLCPTDYHRFHFIDSGICSPSIKIKGCYYSVNPAALKSIPQVFCRNKREYSTLKSDNFGDVLYIEVGATSVGSIIQTYEADRRLKKGDEKGYFKFGGSTVIMLLEKGTALLDDEILEQTELGFETRVLAGEKIGKRIQ